MCQVVFQALSSEQNRIKFQSSWSLHFTGWVRQTNKQDRYIKYIVFQMVVRRKIILGKEMGRVWKEWGGSATQAQCPKKVLLRGYLSKDLNWGGNRLCRSLRQSIPGRRSSKYKGLEAEAHLACLWIRRRSVCLERNNLRAGDQEWSQKGQGGAP